MALGKRMLAAAGTGFAQANVGEAGLRVQGSDYPSPAAPVDRDAMVIPLFPSREESPNVWR